MLPEYEHIIQILASLLAGAILGLEREYHSKPAGFRTILTSAAIIWMAAAIGMCIGFGHYVLGAFVVVLVLLVMIALFKFERIFDNLYQVKVYDIHFISADYSIEALEKEMKGLMIRFERKKIGKQNNVVNVEYNIVVSPPKIREKIDNFLINNSHIKGFEV